ncbi:hypothetical protein DSM43518_04973 [Mycobacterium marinum]|nr:hypothetical protein DSM43518_04973 [Mycobacterium marinum]RFZ29053.1 hypothetical protein DSM44344_01322 [Mycobacterium marinum]RFZ53373.1 hypothetical protein MSS4_00809 [Mycobacterium marinum]
MTLHLIDDHREKSVEQLHHVCGRPVAHQLCRADDIDENNRDITLFAAQLRRLSFRGRGNFASDVAAEKVADAFALTQPLDHGVEAALQLAEFAAVEDHNISP